MDDFTAENARDYIGFLERLKKDVLEISDSAKRLVQHAPMDRAGIMEETAKFMAIFAETAIQTEITLTKLTYTHRIMEG